MFVLWFPTDSAPPTGVQQPKPQTPKQQRRDVRQQMPDTARRIEPLDARTLQSIDALISSYDEHQIEMRAPNALETPSRQASLPLPIKPKSHEKIG